LTALNITTTISCLFS